MRAHEFIKAKRRRETDEDYDPNSTPPGPEFKPTMPPGTVRVDVSDVYDWYKLGQHISNLKGLGKHDFGAGPPSTIFSFGSEPEEHKYIKDLEKTGLTTTDIDPLDPHPPKGMKRQKTDPTYNVNEYDDSVVEGLEHSQQDLDDVADWMNTTPDKLSVQVKQEPIEKFIKQIREMYGTYDEFPEDEERTNRILKLLKRGVQPLPVYVESNDPDLFVMEGRHRMVAFWLIGMKTIPVAYVSVKDTIDEAESYTPASKEIRTSLRSAGYKLLGSGTDATVWAKKSGSVIKIIMPDDGEGAGIAGDTFMKFYEFCKQNRGLENLPKFSGQEVDVFDIDGKEYVMISMERLKPIPQGSFEEAMIWILSDLATKNITWSAALKTIRRESTWAQWTSWTSWTYENTMSYQDITATLKRLDAVGMEQYAVLFTLMKLLYHRGRINKIGWDLHTENAMMRGDTIVITDPWFSSKI